MKMRKEIHKHGADRKRKRKKKRERKKRRRGRRSRRSRSRSRSRRGTGGMIHLTKGELLVKAKYTEKQTWVMTIELLMLIIERQVGVIWPRRRRRRRSRRGSLHNKLIKKLCWKKTNV
jgi:hypothetical protein